MPALPSKADISWGQSNVRQVPIADIQQDYDRSGSNLAARGNITLISVNSPGCVLTSIERYCPEADKRRCCRIVR